MYLATYALDSFVRGVSRSAELEILFPFSPEMRRLAVRALACQVVIATCPPVPSRSLRLLPNHAPRAISISSADGDRDLVASPLAFERAHNVHACARLEEFLLYYQCLRRKTLALARIAKIHGRR